MDPLHCIDLRKSFGGTAALDGVSLSVQSERIIAIIGPNGAGKTTLLNVVTGFLRPDGGRVTLGEADLTRMPPDRIVRAGVARTFQELRLVRLLSVLDNVMLARQGQKGERLWRALARVGVWSGERANRQRAMEVLEVFGLARDASRPAGQLSYGQQKLLTLACCLATDADMLLLDEPVAGVHPEMVETILRFFERLRGDGKRIVFIEHDIHVVNRAAERVVVMDHGKVIADGSPGDVLKRPEILEAYVG